MTEFLAPGGTRLSALPGPKELQGGRGRGARLFPAKHKLSIFIGCTLPRAWVMFACWADMSCRRNMMVLLWETWRSSCSCLPPTSGPLSPLCSLSHKADPTGWPDCPPRSQEWPKPPVCAALACVIEAQGAMGHRP